MELSIKILGARGSVPVSGGAFARYGGATTCVLVRAGGQHLVLDAGTGLLSLPEAALRQRALPLLLTHPHADHLLGLPMCPYIMRPGARLDVYAAQRGALGAEDQVRRLLSPPLWPVGPEALPAEVCFHALSGTLCLGEISVDVLEGEHPGGVSLLRVSVGGRRVVFATDCTLTRTPELEEFARDCELLLCDGQYSPAEQRRFATFGHSSWTEAAELARRCGARRLRVVHHAPQRTDAELDAAAEQIRAMGYDYDFGKEGEELLL